MAEETETQMLARLDDYRRCSAVARKHTKQAASSESRDAYFQIADGFDKLALALERRIILKGRPARPDVEVRRALDTRIAERC
jgi:hypothetical protein